MYSLYSSTWLGKIYLYGMRSYLKHILITHFDTWNNMLIYIDIKIFFFCDETERYLWHLFSSESLGVVPLWGDAPDHVVKEYQTKLGMSDLEMDVLYSAQRTDNINSKLFALGEYGIYS